MHLGLHCSDVQSRADGLRRHKVCKAGSPNGVSGEAAAGAAAAAVASWGSPSARFPGTHRDLPDLKLTPALLIERGDGEQLVQRPTERLQRLQLQHPWRSWRAGKFNDLGAHFQHFSRTAGARVAESGAPRWLQRL